MAYEKKGDRDKAIADFTEAIRLDPKSAQAYANRALAYVEKSEYDKAITDLTEVIRLNPKGALAFWGRGMAYRIRESLTRRSPTSPRPFGSTRNTPLHIATVASPT